MSAKKNKSAIHFVTGSDEAAVKKTARELAGKLAPGADAFGLETIDGAVDLVDPSIARIRQTMQALSTLPFLGGTKLVWLKSASFLADTVAGRSEAVLQALEDLCDLLEAGLAEGVVFLMIAPGADKRRSAYKRLSKAGETVVCDKPALGFGAGEEEVVDWTAQQVSRRGLKISREAVEMLAARIGLESGRLDAELEKLDTALGSGHEIVAEDIRALVPSTRESGIFDLGNAISARNLPLALETLGQLFYQGEKGVGILLASIVPTVRNLMLAKSFMIRHKLRPPAEPQFFARDLSRIPADETAHLPKKKDGTLNTYGLGFAAKHSMHFTLEELRRAFQECAEANQRMVSGLGSDSVVLTRLLVGFLQRTS